MTRPHSSKLTLSPQDHGLEITHEEFADAEFQKPWRYERVDGRLLVMTPAGDGHQSTTEPFRSHIGAYALSHPDIVDHVYQDSWVVIDEDTERFPDVAVYFRSDELPPAIPQRLPEIDL